MTLEAWVREGARRGFEQQVVVGVPGEDAAPGVGALPADRIHAVVFGGEELPFPVPGMSDVMPYESSRWSALDEANLERYRRAWRRRLRAILESFEPDVVHAHHLWVVSSMLKDVAPSVPLVIQSHATGLRQMDLCPHLAPSVIDGCARAERVLALGSEHARTLAERTGIPRERIRVVGAGYREDLFRPPPSPRRDPGGLLYVGKYSRAKGLPWLLDAFARLLEERPHLTLHLAGEAAGEEGRALAGRAETFGDRVVRHGHLSQPALAALLGEVSALVLPSLYEGLPLVLVEAAASGCRGLVTRLPAVERDLAPRLGRWLRLVDPPRRIGPDEPVPEDLPAFVTALVDGLRDVLDDPEPPPVDLSGFTWPAAFDRVLAAWAEARREAEVAEGGGDR